MKIAVFATCWSEECLRNYCSGFRSWARDQKAVVDIFTNYGTIGLDDKFNWGEYRIFDLPKLKEYDGAVLIDSTINEPVVREHLYQRVLKAKIPCVTIDNKVQGFSSIGIDQKYYVKQIVEHLIVDHGIEELCYVGAPRQSVEAETRLAGFLLAMEENHIPIRREWMYEKSYEYHDGMDVVTELHAKNSMPRAFVCANDDMASGVCEALMTMGYRVGEDVLVTGFDNFFLGENYSPRLTTVRRPRESIVYRACEMIAGQVSCGKGEEEVFLQGNLVRGETCGCGCEHCGDQGEFRRIVFHRENNKKSIDLLLAEMEEHIMAGESLSDVIAKVGSMLNSLGVGRCRIMLTPDIDQETQVSHQDYRECTRECLVWNAPTSDSLQIEGNAYIYCPLHFQDHLYGYCVFRDAEQLMVDRELYQFTKSIGFSIENVVEKMQYERLNNKLEHLYETDSLTGVYNRHGMKRIAERFMKEKHREGVAVNVLFVDIDSLKAINDTYGHEAGDYTIQVVGKALLHFQDENCKVFRYGGDEFIMIREAGENFEELVRAVKREISMLQEKEKKPFAISASMGYVTANANDGQSLRKYIERADKEMYMVKKERHG